ncbi:MAG: DUF4870 domain-containing protein [Thermomicrobiales bacterium]
MQDQPFGGPPPGVPPQQNLQPTEDNDKIMAALCYFFFIIMGIIVLVTDMKNKPFLKYHAYQSIVFGVALAIGWIIASVLSVAIIGLCLMPVLFIVQIYYTYVAYSKGIFTIPLITDLTAKVFPDFPGQQTTQL